jgi:hypothetical protein
MSGMTITPGAGTYIAIFSCDLQCDRNLRTGLVSIFYNGTQDTTSEREAGYTQNSITGVCCIAEVTVADAQAVDVRWRVDSTAGGPTIAAQARTLVLFKVS